MPPPSHPIRRHEALVSIVWIDRYSSDYGSPGLLISNPVGTVLYDSVTTANLMSYSATDCINRSCISRYLAKRFTFAKSMRPAGTLTVLCPEFALVEQWSMKLKMKIFLTLLTLVNIVIEQEHDFSSNVINIVMYKYNRRSCRRPGWS